MYSFKDTVPVSGSGSSTISLSAESVAIDGEWLEQQIPGFRVLSTSGRESLGAEVDMYTVGFRNGAKKRARRYPEREIRVQYQIISGTNTAFREAFNALGRLLNVEDVTIIFNDEADKYFIGTPTGVGEVEPGRNSVIGEFTILCTDPFKYDRAMHEIAISTNVSSPTLIEYAGAIPCHPQLEVHFYQGNSADIVAGNGQCGYAAFVDAAGHSIAIGDPAQEEASNVILHQNFVPSSSTFPTGWTINRANTHTMPLGSNTVTGTVSRKQNWTAGSYGVGIDSYGSGNGWHGPMITKSITASANFTANFKLDFGVHVSRRRMVQLLMHDAQGNVIAGMAVSKWKVGTGKASLIFYIDDAEVLSTTINIGTSQSCWIRKTGTNIVFNAYGVRKGFNASAVSASQAEFVSVAFSAYKTDTAMGKDTYTLLKELSVQKDPAGGAVNATNSFRANDEAIIDCASGLVYLNDQYAPEYGSPDNDWEEFVLSPGSNLIGGVYSDWVMSSYAPTFILKYRGRYI